MDISQIKNHIKNVNGFLSDKEGELLYNLAKNYKGDGVIVEIGSWQGKSTIWLGHGSMCGRNKKIYAIDPHIGSAEHQENRKKVWTFDKFKKNIKNEKLDKLIIPIIKTSQEACKNFNRPVGIIFIDGAHDYKSAKLDFDIWFPKVIENGIMAFHDTTIWDGPRRVVKNFIYKSRYFKDIHFVDTITFATKVKKNSFKDQIKNRYMLIVSILYDKLTKFHPPVFIKRIGKLIFQKIQ